MRAIVTKFMAVCRGLHAIDFPSLLECGVTIPKVYVFDENSQSAVIPDIGELAWPVEFIVGKFHKKHVFGDG